MSRRDFRRLKKAVKIVDKHLDKNSAPPSVKPTRRKLRQFNTIKF